ncbi:MAG TPA: DUF507 family protein [Kofleriaceae bacterium]|nr:DUF507 family protein [Kofleriaceae bacterium]
MKAIVHIQKSRRKTPRETAPNLARPPSGPYSAARMRLYPGKVDTIAAEIITSLTQAGDIEVSDNNEAQLDAAAVLKEYIRVDKELTERAKDILEIRGLPYSHLGRTKRQLADQKEFGLGEEGLSWIANQMLEAFMSSRHVDEVFADDTILRRKIKDICKKHMQVDEAIDQEVRDRIKNLEEGTQAWEIEYAKVLDQIKTKHGIKE